MADVVGDIAVRVSGQTFELEQSMARAGRSVDGLGARAGALTGRMVAMGAAAAAAGTALGVKMVGDSVKAAKEIQNLSNLAGIGAEQFQRLAAAGEAVGFSQEKMADIFKDVNDKFGDFLANGAGPLKDFFENIAPQVGVTAEEFARLAGPDALQLYVKSLEDAGVSQQQMTFYMEALANDATALIPLLRDSGRAMNELGQEADKAGRVIDEALIKRGAEMADKWREIMNSMLSNTYTFALQAASALDNAFGITDSGRKELLRNQLNTTIDERNDFIEKTLSKTQTKLDEILEADAAGTGTGLGGDTLVQTLRNKLANEQETLAAYEQDINLFNDDLLLIQEEERTRKERLAALNAGIDRPSDTAEVSPSGGGGGGDTVSGLEALRESLASQTEQLDIWREEQLTKLREYRDQKLVTEEEYNELERQINERHAESMGRIERRSMQTRLSGVKSSLGSVASLMQSENDKLFKIGKAASLANAIVNGHEAASEAWNKGMAVGGPPIAAAFTAASILRTGALIQSIQSANSRGSSTGVGVSSGSSVATSAPVAPSEPEVSRNVAIQLQGEVFNAAQVRSLINQINEEVEDGAVIRLV